MSWGRLPGQEVPEGEFQWEARKHPPGMRLQDRFSLVTGGGRGFGKTIALALAKEGSNVAVSYNKSEAGAEETSQEIRKLGRKSIAVKADTTNWEEVKAMVERVFKEFGRLDVLINNVGEMATGQMSWREITEESIDNTLAVDIKGTMLVTHEVGLRMLQQKSGVIVNVCSNVVVTGSPRAPQYAASKYGVLGLTKSYAHAFGPFVRVNAAGPGYMETEATKVRPDWPQRKKWVVEHSPLRRIARPEDIVPVILFLASDDSNMMTGNYFVCDGGFSMPGA